MPLKEDIKDVQETVINELTSANGLTTTLASNSVTESEIASGAVIEGKIGTSAVTETKIANGAVTAAKLGSDVDLTPADGSITPAKLDRAYLETTGGTVSGNVGIGGSPSVKLHMVRNAENTLRIEDTLDNTTMDLRADSVGGFVRTNGSYPLRFLTNSTESMRIDSSGNVGIGTSSPNDKIDISGSTGDGYRLTDGTHTAVFRSISGGAILKTASNHALLLGTNDTERMRIQSDGTIKISNSSEPSTPSGGGVLYVQNGALKFKGSSGTVTTIANA